MTDDPTPASKADFQPPGPRIVVVGITGCGKTTTALRLASILSVPHVELDSLHWMPNWVMAERDVFRARVAQALSGPCWVTDGNYSKARDLIWGRATAIIWLDYPLPVIMWQLFRRTIRRVVTREVLWNGNRETLGGAFLSQDLLFLWALQTYPIYRQEYAYAFADPANAHRKLVRLRSRRETAAWLAQLEAASP